MFPFFYKAQTLQQFNKNASYMDTTLPDFYMDDLTLQAGL